ncbi:MAG: VOC family protein, partial [Acidobacteriota bacterium]
MPILPPDFRAPDRTHVGRVTIQVADLERSVAFYVDLLGFAVLAREIAPRGASARLGAEADGRALLEIRERPGVRPVPRRGLLGLYHFAVLLPSRADLGRLLAHLHARQVPMGAADHLVSEALYLVDPDGITVEMYRDRPRAEWTPRGDELAMASDPLDTAGLLRAGAGAPFAGLVTGTTIGHVHFYVDDLKQAASFYHQGLGLDQMVWSFPGALFMAAGGYHHHVGANIWAAGSRVATEDDAKLVEWELVMPTLEDVRAAGDSVRRAGHDVTSGADDEVASDPW